MKNGASWRRAALLWISSAALLPLAGQSAKLAPSSMAKTGTVDARFQSYNIEMIEVTGGRFWKPYKQIAGATSMADLYAYRPPIDLSNARLRKLAAALGPAYIRVSGTWANSVYFHDSDEPAPQKPPEGFNGVLTRAQWKGVLDFTRAAGGSLVTSFATSVGTRDASGLWTPAQAQRWLAFTKAAGGRIAAAEFMNEPTFAGMGGAPKGYDAAAYGRDIAAFRPFFRKALPGAILLGPGSVGEGGVLDNAPFPGRLKTEDLLKATGPVDDAFAYHIYPAVSQRCSATTPAIGTTKDAALTAALLARPAAVQAFYAGLRDRYEPGKPLWVTETADAACGGNPWDSTFRDSFRYLNLLGLLARQHVQVVMHNTLAASDYGLLDEETLRPRPDYWAAVLWRRLMGSTVLDAGAAPSPDVHLYAHCSPQRRGAVTVLAINASAEEQTLESPLAGERYTLSAPSLDSETVELNGKALEAADDGTLPSLGGAAVAAGPVNLPATSITFLTFPKAANRACR